jgi:type IV secretion system protein VirB5
MTPFRRPSVRYGKTPEPETPYQKAAQVWDDRIGSARVQARNWRLIAFGNLALAAGVAAGLVWQSANGTIVPWVVQVDRFGAAQAVAPAIADYRPTDTQIARHLARFIEEVRGITTDPVIVRQNWLQAYNFVTDKGALALNDYARMITPAQTNLSPKSDGFRWRPTSLASSAPRVIPSASPGRNAATRMARWPRPNAGPPY